MGRSRRAILPLVGLITANASGEYNRSSDMPMSQCLHGPCRPGNEYCGQPFKNAPGYHLMDQHGCGENDPNGPVFDPVHGVIHHFYQIHLAAAPGHGPDYGHFVSKDFVNWASLPVAIWNGLDSSVTPPRVTKYDNEAIFTGSAFVLDGAGPDGQGPGVVQIYPGLCNKKDWPGCATGTLLAQAVPADYVNDELLVNWTKPSYNPIMENTQRDPSSPWKTPSGEWRLRTFDSNIYAASSDADVLAGKWYKAGVNKDFRTCECPSFYPLPAPTPGFEAVYETAKQAGSLPTHVHKTSCGGDWWQLGTYTAGTPASGDEAAAPDQFKATPGWEDVFAQKRIDFGQFYASKDNEYPTKDGGTRRINWGWATVPPASTQSLPREITFNAAARTLEQAPIEELQSLRGPGAVARKNQQVTPDAPLHLNVTAGTVQQSEMVAAFELPQVAATISIQIGSKASVEQPSPGLRKSSIFSCVVEFVPPKTPSAAFYEVPVVCGKVRDTLRLLHDERTIEVRIFSDRTFVEAYFQKGRVAMTVDTGNALQENSDISLTSTAAISANAIDVYPLRSIWVTPDDVRKGPRVFPKADSAKPEIV